MDRIVSKNIKEITSLIKKREITCVELIKAYLEQIVKYDPVLECFISLYSRETLIKQAEESDARWQNKAQKSLIDGLPIAIKDNIHSMGIATTCASKILENYYPPYDATTIKMIKGKGGIIIGKTNLDEFAMGSTCENSSLKHTRNPWDLNRVPGGSSGGSAAAVSSGMVPLAIGSDTGGSIRQPAAFCGIFGLKPTYGLVSRYGLTAYASSLDQIGPLSRDVYGIAILLNAISGYDKNDSTSLDIPSKDYTAKLDQDIAGMRIAVLPELFQEGVSPQIREQFKKSIGMLKGLGAQIEDVSFSALQYATSAYYFIATAEASSNLSRYDGVKYGYRNSRQSDYQEMLRMTRSVGFGKEVKKRILLGNFVLSSGYYDEYYRKAQRVRAYLREELKKIFETFDAIAMPTTPEIAFPIGESLKDPMKIYLSDVTTVLPNLAGLPAISVPSGMVNDMPVGLQLMGRALEEENLLKIAFAFEKQLRDEFIPPLEEVFADKDRIVCKTGAREEGGREEATSIYTQEDINKISKTYMQRDKNYSDRVYCNDLEDYVNKDIKIAGWIHRKKNLGGIEFYDLRDRSGFTQLVIEGDGLKERLNLETVVEIYGQVTKEERSPYNNIEIKVKTINIIGRAANDLPISINNNSGNINLPTILDNRTISVRNPKILNTFRIQSEIVKLFGEYLSEHKFIEIKTPKIISSGTEGGSNIFEIKYFGNSAFLAQSPQFYKQTMVGSGFERVFEIGPVFRAELHNTVRHLNEYVSLDYEMGFIKDEQDIIDMQEGLIKYIFKKLKEKFAYELEEAGSPIDLPEIIPRIHFLEALEIVESFGIRDMEEGDISPEGERVICEYFEREKNSSLVYIIGYPVKKRPMYTMPDERLPGYTRSFDLLYNGIEITTGGQRIHDYDMLRENVLSFGCNPRDFSHYMDIFRFGMPPHGGLGMGLERLTMKILNLKNIREASLFPRDINRLSP